jgi:hypothetical protein
VGQAKHAIKAANCQSAASAHGRAEVSLLMCVWGGGGGRGMTCATGVGHKKVQCHLLYAWHIRRCSAFCCSPDAGHATGGMSTHLWMYTIF